MEFLSFEQKELINSSLCRIENAIIQLLDWNVDVTSSEAWVHSSVGMQHLAANCMLIEAIGEAVKHIEKRAGMEFLLQCSDIPWREIMSMRNHIAHGYFEIDADFVYNVIRYDLPELLEAVRYLQTTL